MKAQPQYLKNPKSKVLPQPSFISSNNTYAPYFLGQSQVYSNQVQSLNAEIQKFPQDIDYRKNLMLNAGKNPNDYYKLRAIIGAEEIKSLMKDFSEDESKYSVGENDINIKEKQIRANLHIHTLASDGFLNPKELLDKAAIYADEVVKAHPEYKDKPFTIAITDHDTAKSAKEAIEIISQDPLKYKNLRVILGIEATTYNNISTKIKKQPSNIHTLVYGIDPNEKIFNNFINSTIAAKQKLLSKMINSANKTYQKGFYTNKTLFSLQEAKEFYNPLEKGILGIFNYTQSYIKIKIILEKAILSKHFFKNQLQKNNLPTNPDALMKEVQNFYYPIDKNNKPRNANEVITTFLSEKINMKKDDIQELIKQDEEYGNLAEFNKNIKKNLEKYKVTLRPKYHYMPTFKTLYASLRAQPGAIIGIAHPLDQTSAIMENDYKYRFLIDLYSQFREKCKEKAIFSEVYYQSYNDELKLLKENPTTKILLDFLSKKFHLFKTGSADSHRTNIFKRLL